MALVYKNLSTTSPWPKDILGKGNISQNFTKGIGATSKILRPSPQVDKQKRSQKFFQPFFRQDFCEGKGVNLNLLPKEGHFWTLCPDMPRELCTPLPKHEISYEK
jgi:hypothetical protein